MELLETYSMTVISLGLVSLLMLIQLLVVDLVGLSAKHNPGHGVDENHDLLLFRAVRAQANTNESIGLFILLVLFGLFSAADPIWLARFTALYTLGRAGHMICYYANLKLARSIAFGLALIGLLGMFVVALMPWLS